MKRLRRPPIRQLVGRLDTLALGAFVAFSLACPAFATTTSGTSMPWETPLQTVQDSLSGPVAKAIGIIAIVMTGLGFAVAESGSVEGFEIAFHSSLSEPITIAGVPRMIAVLNGTLTAVLALGLQTPLIGIPLGLAVHAGCYWLNKRDPYFFDALKRHLRQRPYWDA